MSEHRRHLRCIIGVGLLLTLFFCLPAPTRAALVSPGDLSRFHQELDSVTQCKQCHGRGEAVADQCLACHTDLDHRIADEAGYHGRLAQEDKLRPCATCHREHQGRAMDLIPEEKLKPSKFRHADVGYPLDGSHATLECRDCHVPKFQHAEWEAPDSINPERTWLGLGTACSDCHDSPHHKDLQWSTCADCHQTDTPFAEAPLSITRHAETRYALEGAHASVRCRDCHRGASFEQRHAFPEKIACRTCHDPAAHPETLQQTRLLFGPSCQDCHTSVRFAPSRIGIDKHAQTDFGLTGAHLSVPCQDCHKPHPIVGDRTLLVPAKQQVPLHIDDHADCERCHENVHKKQFDVYGFEGTCRHCHVTDRWGRVRFDHDATGFVLDGAHAKADCVACHQDGARRQLAPRQSVPVRPCAACHGDPHADQFATDPPRTCEDCHGTSTFRRRDDWNHAKEAGWALGDAHESVACSECHIDYSNGERTVQQFRGVPRECSACHANPHKGMQP
ncbi:MAG: hypothetical protein D6761_10805 [Candidatus Dadabacteria bacterium]|nr:MAG: hypothetical protein D6761_10805 [Candidatus Dadabacteria bacterium]